MFVKRWKPEGRSDFTASDVHSVDRGPGKTDGVGETKQEGTLGDVAHLSVVDCHHSTGTATVDTTRVDTMSESFASYLPLRCLLQEVSI